MRVIRVTYLEADEFSLDRENEKDGIVFNLDTIDLTTRDGREVFVQRVGQWIDGSVLPRGASS